MTPAQIAAKLTYKEAQALKGWFAWDCPMEQEQGERKLYQLGLWNPRPAYGEKIITPLGKSVCEVLGN